MPHRSPRIHIGTDVYEDLLATHAVKSFAKEHGVDINQVKVVWSYRRQVPKEDAFSKKTYFLIRSQLKVRVRGLKKVQYRPRPKTRW